MIMWMIINTIHQKKKTFTPWVMTNCQSHCINRLNPLRPRWNEQHFADDIFKRIFFNENVWISIKISPKFVPKGPINNIPALVQIMAWRPPGDKPLSEPMMVNLPTHICVTRPQWVKWLAAIWSSHFIKFCDGRLSLIISTLELPKIKWLFATWKKCWLNFLSKKLLFCVVCCFN